MKKISVLKLGLTFAGCFLGAGYVSGQELWHFFGHFGREGLWGLLVAAFCLGAVGVVVLRLARMTGTEDMGRLVSPVDSAFLRALPSVLEPVFLFGTSTVMAAGVGALLNQLFAVPAWVGCAVFTAAVAVMSLGGVGGMVSVFSFSVPIMVLATLGFGAAELIVNGLPAVPAFDGHIENPLLSHWLVSAFAFASYNIFESVAILAPLGKMLPSRKTALSGIAVGTAALLAIALSVLVSLYDDPAARTLELPMLKAATDLHPSLGYVYGFLLLVSMFGTSLSCLVTLEDFICHKAPRLKDRRRAVTVVCAAGMFAGSLAGFGELISVIYPILGYCSVIFIILLVIHYIKVRRRVKKVPAENAERE